MVEADITTPTRAIALSFKTSFGNAKLLDSDGSYYYQNTNGSTYYNSGTGYSQYTPPSGK